MVVLRLHETETESMQSQMRELLCKEVLGETVEQFEAGRGRMEDDGVLHEEANKFVSGLENAERFCSYERGRERERERGRHNNQGSVHPVDGVLATERLRSCCEHSPARGELGTRQSGRRFTLEHLQRLLLSAKTSPRRETAAYRCLCTGMKLIYYLSISSFHISHIYLTHSRSFSFSLSLFRAL